jgi:hypothetical protein
MQDGVEAVPVVADLSCGTERETLQTAIDTFTMLEGAPPATEADLVTEGYLRDESTMFDLDPAGAIVPAPTSRCS